MLGYLCLTIVLNLIVFSWFVCVVLFGLFGFTCRLWCWLVWVGLDLYLDLCLVFSLLCCFGIVCVFWDVWFKVTYFDLFYILLDCLVGFDILMLFVYLICFVGLF